MSPPLSPFFRSASKLFLVSFLGLYFEMVLIRWIPGQVQIIGYFNNLVLIAAFLGLGLGCASWQRARQPGLAFAFSLLMLCSLCLGISQLGLFPVGLDAEEFTAHSALGPVPSFAAAVIIFIAVSLTLLPLGRLLGTALAPLPPLAGYSLNLAGSLLGVLALAALRSFQTGPLLWFGLGLALSLPLLLSARQKLISLSALAAVGGVMVIVGMLSGEERWSPYYKIKVENSFVFKIMNRQTAIPLGQAGWCITINDTFFQYALNLDPDFISSLDQDQWWVQKLLRDSSNFYHLPYRLFQPQSVLILGAGAGNDAAAALFYPIPRIVAVEIDPFIAQLGRDLHPLRPYQNPRVKLVIDDARHFLHSSPEKFDLIVYGLLDSHLLLSHLSTVRLESFVYTLEGLKAAARLLNPGGAIILTHASESDTPQQTRLFQELATLFPGHTWAVSLEDFLWNTILAGPELPPPRLEPGSGLINRTAEYQSRPSLRLATDDWPFIYLTTDSFFRTGYFKTLLLLLLVSFLLVLRVLPESQNLLPSLLRKNLSASTAPPLSPAENPAIPAGHASVNALHFFLLGAAFLLLQTKSILSLSLLFGSTWVVTSIAVAAFLLMGILATLVVHLLQPRRPLPFYLLLFLSLGLAAFLPLHFFLGASLPLRLLLGAGSAALPVLFSGVIFAQSFRLVSTPSAALAANLTGAVAGGFLEYTSLFEGSRFLYLLAALLYVGSWVFLRQERKG